MTWSNIRSITSSVGALKKNSLSNPKKQIVYCLQEGEELLNEWSAYVTIKLHKSEWIYELSCAKNWAGVKSLVDMQENIWPVLGTPTSHGALVIYNDRKANTHIFGCTVWWRGTSLPLPEKSWTTCSRLYVLVPLELCEYNEPVGDCENGTRRSTRRDWYEKGRFKRHFHLSLTFS